MQNHFNMINSCLSQIGFAATSEQLSRKLKFPTFLRTISSDKYQTKALAELVNQFNWKTVAIVGSDDEYGKFGSDSLEDIFESMEICNEFIDILPGSFSPNHTRLADLVSKINKSSAEAIILFTSHANVHVIMEEAIKCNLSRTWIASDTWSTSRKISALPGIEMAGQVFGFVSKMNEVPGFEDYVTSMFNGTTNAILEHYLTHYPLCSDQSEENSGNNCPPTNSQQQCLDTCSLASYIDRDESYNIYLAVQVIVEGLKGLLKCSKSQCERSAEFTALEVQ